MSLQYQSTLQAFYPAVQCASHNRQNATRKALSINGCEANRKQNRKLASVKGFFKCSVSNVQLEQMHSHSSDRQIDRAIEEKKTSFCTWCSCMLVCALTNSSLAYRKPKATYRRMDMASSHWLLDNY